MFRELNMWQKCVHNFWLKNLMSKMPNGRFQVSALLHIRKIDVKENVSPPTPPPHGILVSLPKERGRKSLAGDQNIFLQKWV
jgi:hypothetical protein